MPAQTIIKFRRDTAANWTSTNPVLTSGEPGLESDTGKLKIGNGTDAWADLSYLSGGASVEVSDTPPMDPEPNTLWWESDTATLFIYYDDFWVEATSAGPIGPTGATGATGPAGPQGPAGGFSSTQTIETISTNKTIASADAGKLILNSAAVTVTVQGLSIGQQVDFLQSNAAQITFVAGSGNTLSSKGGKLKTAAQGSPASIKCVATNTYWLLGDLG